METSQLSAAETQTRPGPRGGRIEPDASGNGNQAGHGNGAADHDRIDLNVPKARTGWVIAVAVAAVLAVAVLLVVGLLPRLRTGKELAADANAAANAPVPVSVVHPRRAPAVIDVRLPGTLRPWQEVSLHARTTGYMKKYYVDISNQVEKGQVMADIESPEVDAQLRGAQATLT